MSAEARPGLLVRPAQPGDAPAIARVLATALGDKFRAAYGARVEPVLAALARHDIGRRGEHHLVAELEGAVVGAVHLTFAEEPDPAFADRVAAEAGRLGALRALVVLSALAHARLQPDEAYVEELGVVPEARRRGVARALLSACEEEARRRGRRYLTLWVTCENAPAIALYERTGFRARRHKRTVAGRLFFGTRGMLLMEKPL
jgi:ribosomal protein S18 acetylase RimI-like enzyme